MKIENFYQITAQELYEKGKDYNPAEWKKIIDRYVSMSGVFYIVPVGQGYDYERYFVVRNRVGILILDKVSYSCTLSSHSYVRVFIDNEKHTMETYEVKFKDGRSGRLNDTPEARKAMAEWTGMGIIWTSEF